MSETVTTEPETEPIIQEMIEKRINTPEQLKALRMWAFKCPECHKFCFKMTDIRTDVNDRHGYLSNNRCFNCDTLLDYERDIEGDSHDIENEDYLIGWAVEGRTGRGQLRVQPYIRTRCIYCNEEHYLPMKNNRIAFNECICQRGKPIKQEPYKPLEAPKAQPVEEKVIEVAKSKHIVTVPDVFKCSVCGQDDFKDTRGLKNHLRYKHNIPPLDPHRKLATCSPFHAVENAGLVDVEEPVKPVEAPVLAPMPVEVPQVPIEVKALEPKWTAQPKVLMQKSKEGDSYDMTIKIPSELAGGLKDKAFELDMTKTQIVIEALRYYLAKPD